MTVEDGLEGAKQQQGRGEGATLTTGGRLADVEVQATLEFGGVDLRLQEVVTLAQGVTVLLDREVEEPVHIVVGDRVVATGRVMLAAGQFAVTILECVPDQQSEEGVKA